MSWFADDEKDKPSTETDSAAAYPSLKSVPARPKNPSLAQQQAKMTRGLAGDSKNARYTDAQIRKEVQKRAVPPLARKQQSAARPSAPAPSRAVAEPPRSQLKAVTPPARRVPPPVKAQRSAAPPPPVAQPIRRPALAAVPPVPKINNPAPVVRRTPPQRGATAPSPAPKASTANVAPAQIASIYFGDGSTTVKRQDISILRQIANAQRLTGGLLELVGHASGRANTFDPVRRNSINYGVSVRRAKSVAAALVGLGVPTSQLRVEGVGDSRQIYSEFTAAGEAANRRVEVFLIR
ncbi:MAG: OmpA family protein [Alphaproteobacteria bacterium]|nr:OmpA family protein [Alphaproteobacteria bacterium]